MTPMQEPSHPRLPRLLPPALTSRWRALSPARRGHVERVAALARELARRHGIDPEQAELAALTHDLARELDAAELRAEAAESGWPDLDPVEWAYPVLLHGPVAAAWLQRLGAPAPVVEAVRYHTTGAPGLGALGQVLLIADGVEPGRHYPERAAIEELARRDLAAGYRAALASTVAFLRQAGLTVHPRTLAALAALSVQPSGNNLTGGR